MNHPAEFEQDLKIHQELCKEILALPGKEGEGADQAAQSEPKKKILAQLGQSLDKIREHRKAWLKLKPAERQAHPEITELLRENQNLIMRILVLDRENEKVRPRKALLPERQNPSADGPQPHFVSNLYRRNSYA